MPQTCHSMQEGEVLNASHSKYPLLHATLYGSKLNTAKLSKRLSCAIKHLPIRVEFKYEYDTLKAVEAGISQDPSFTLNGEIFLEGLVQAEEITQAFKAILLKRKKY